MRCRGRRTRLNDAGAARPRFCCIWSAEAAVPSGSRAIPEVGSESSLRCFRLESPVTGKVVLPSAEAQK